jgi:hypothetical protein
MFPFILVCRSESVLYMQMLDLRRGARVRSTIRKPCKKFKDIYFRGRLRRPERLLQVPSNYVRSKNNVRPTFYKLFLFLPIFLISDFKITKKIFNKIHFWHDVIITYLTRFNGGIKICSKNTGATSKLKALKGCHEARSVLRTHNFGVTCNPIIQRFLLVAFALSSKPPIGFLKSVRLSVCSPCKNFREIWY